VGIFGGSFDPVHQAHLALARSSLQALQLDELRWIPTGNPWQKTRTVTDAVHRVAMVQAAIAGEPRFVLDRIEVDRSGPSYTLDTVRALTSGRDGAPEGPPDATPDSPPAHAQVPAGTQWFLIIGQDQYSSLHTWRHWQELLSLVTLAVANRPGDNRAPHADVQRLAHHMVPLPMLDISSTQIRQRVAAGQDITPLVPPAVARYIELHGLYRSPAGS
jgi:nicotinate-nucleotide adenylyltransferase